MPITASSSSEHTSTECEILSRHIQQLTPITSGRKRKRGCDQAITYALGAATSTLAKLANKMENKNVTTTTTHDDLFFQSLAGQFKLLNENVQPTVMLKLQEVITNARLNQNTLTYDPDTLQTYHNL